MQYDMHICIHIIIQGQMMHKILFAWLDNHITSMEANNCFN